MSDYILRVSSHNLARNVDPESDIKVFDLNHDASKLVEVADAVIYTAPSGKVTILKNRYNKEIK